MGLTIPYFDVERESNICNCEPFVNLLPNVVWESQRDYLRLLQSMDRK